MKITRKILALIFAVLMLLTFAACGGSSNTDGTDTTRSNSVSETTEPTTTETSEPTTTETSEPTTTETSEPAVPKGPAVLSIEAEDATPYNTKENAVPLGQWVYYQAKNFTSGEYEPFYVRIIGVSRDKTEIQSAIDSYKGIMDFKLTEDQARDIEYGILEYEIYFAPDYSAPESGISIPSITWGASPIKTTGFKTDGGMSYIGVGKAYKLEINGSSYHPQPGDTVKDKSLFTVLNNYDESEYVIHITWYDGEIVSDKARELYFAVS